MSRLYGMELIELEYQGAIEYLRSVGKGSGVMRMLRDSQGEAHLRPFCLCRDSTNFDSRDYRISEELFHRLRDEGVLTGNTYIGYNRWIICCFVPEQYAEAVKE